MDRARSKRKHPPPDPRSDSRLGRRYFYALVLLVFFAAVLQILLRFDGVRRYLNLAIRLEGLPLVREVQGLGTSAYPWLDYIAPGAETGTIYLRLIRRPKGEVWILVNQRAVKVLDEEGEAVTVQEDDFIEVYSRDGEVRVLVSGASPNIEFPGVGAFVAGRGTVLVGRVRFR
ncbi:MAG: hypothetical protein ACM3WU_09815 [Bacillota bacterium]